MYIGHMFTLSFFKLFIKFIFICMFVCMFLLYEERSLQPLMSKEYEMSLALNRTH